MNSTSWFIDLVRVYKTPILKGFQEMTDSIPSTFNSPKGRFLKGDCYERVFAKVVPGIKCDDVIDHDHVAAKVFSSAGRRVLVSMKTQNPIFADHRKVAFVLKNGRNSNVEVPKFDYLLAFQPQKHDKKGRLVQEATIGVISRERILPFVSSHSDEIHASIRTDDCDFSASEQFDVVCKDDSTLKLVADECMNSMITQLLEVQGKIRSAPAIQF